MLIFRLLFNQDVDLLHQLLVRRLRKVVRVQVSHGLTASVLVLTEGYEAVQPHVFASWVHQVLELLVERLASILIGLHTILNFILAFLLSIKLLDTNQIKSIRYQMTLHFQI